MMQTIPYQKAGENNNIMTILCIHKGRPQNFAHFFVAGKNLQ